MTDTTARPPRRPDAVVGTDLTVVVPTRNEAGNIQVLVDRLDAAFDAAGLDRPRQRSCSSTTATTTRRIAYSSAAAHARHPRPAPAPRARRARRRPRIGRAGGVPRRRHAVGRRHGRRPAAPARARARAGPRRVRPGPATWSWPVGTAARATPTGLGGATRHAVSRASTTLTKLLFPRRMRSCSDPMSGMFAVRLERIDLDSLRPNGFKILMEVLARSPRLRVSEVPFSVRRTAQRREQGLAARGCAVRAASAGPAGRDGARPAHRPRRADRRVRRGGGDRYRREHRSRSGCSSTSSACRCSGEPRSPRRSSTLWNFVLTDRLIFRGAKSLGTMLELLGFAVVNNAALLLRLPLLHWLTSDLHLNYLWANAVDVRRRLRRPIRVVRPLSVPSERDHDRPCRTPDDPVPCRLTAKRAENVRRAAPARSTSSSTCGRTQRRGSTGWRCRHRSATTSTASCASRPRSSWPSSRASAPSVDRTHSRSRHRDRGRVGSRRARSAAGPASRSTCHRRRSPTRSISDAAAPTSTSRWATPSASWPARC